MTTRTPSRRPATQKLLRRVARRQRAASMGRRAHVFLLLLAGVYCLGLLASRLLAVLPDWFGWPTLLGVPAAAAVLGALLHRRPAERETARLVDTRADTHDLFLTSVLADESPGEYKPLVLGQAERRAASVEPRDVVPCSWRLKAAQAALVVVLLLLGVWFLPQLDPFGKEKGREELARRRQQLEQAGEEAERRAVLLKKKRPDAEVSKAAEQAIRDLKAELAAMKPSEAARNRDRLAAVQQRLNRLWRERSTERLRDSLARGRTAQQFGAAKGEHDAEWRRQLRQGDTSGMQNSLDEVKEQARQLERLSDPDAQRELRNDMRRRLKDMERFTTANANSQSLGKGLKRALEQLGESKTPQLSDEALEALKKTLEATKLEAASLGQAIRDVEAIEKALKLVQLAKRLNELKGLDGKACQGGGKLEELAQRLGVLVAQLQGIQVVRVPGTGQGRKGEGGKGKGRGEGGAAKEDPKTKTKFQPQLSRSAIRAGKTLLLMKQRDPKAEVGKAKDDYQRGVEAVKRGVGEAILKERVPPGYHEAIKKYFDTLRTTREKP